MSLTLSYSSKSLIKLGGDIDDFTTKLKIKHVRYNGIKALAFYFYDIREVESGGNEQCSNRVHDDDELILNNSSQ